MRHYLKALIISAIAFYASYTIVPTIRLGSDPKNIAIVIGSIFFVSALIRPIFGIVLLPINILTLGSMSLILNTVLVYVLTIYLPGFGIGAFDFKGAQIDGFILPAYSFNGIATIILIAIIITFVQKILHIIFE